MQAIYPDIRSLVIEDMTDEDTPRSQDDARAPPQENEDVRRPQGNENDVRRPQDSKNVRPLPSARLVHVPPKRKGRTGMQGLSVWTYGSIDTKI